MYKTSKKGSLILMCSVLAFSCSTNLQKVENLQENKNFNTLSSPQPKESTDPDFKKVMPDFSGINLVKENKLEKVQENELNLDFETLPSEKAEVIDGSISVIFKNDYKIRSKNKKNLYSKSSKNVANLNEILENNGLLSISSLEGEYTEEEIEKSHEKTKSFYGINSNIPDMASLYTFNFPKGTNTRKISEELRKLDFVRTAYPSLKIEASGTGSSVGTKQTPSNYTYSPLPYDQFTSNSYPESTGKWYFDRHRIFQAQDLFANTTKPKIAVLDEGFDIQNYPSDRPNYQTGYSVTCQPSCSFLTNDLFEPTTGNLSNSHGTEVSSIIGSPKDNGQGLCGVLPDTPIIPIRLNAYANTNPSQLSNGPTEVIAGINKAVQEGADVINMSLQDGVNIPVTYDNNIRAAVSNAIASGTIVVICAGNGTNEVTDTYPGNPKLGIYYVPDVGEIIVGGTMNDQNTGGSSAWQTGSYVGSAYGPRIDLSAGSKSIYARTYQAQYPYDSTKRMGTNVDGTSFATPMVATVAGMVKKIAQASGLSLTPLQVRMILTHSANLTRYSSGYSDTPETKFIGRYLNNSSINENLKVGVRELNAYNALLIAKNLGSTNAMTRISNIDDVTWSSINANWNSKYGDDAYGYDSTYQLYSMINGDSLNFATYNFSGGYTYGYQYFRRYSANSLYIYEKFGGVKGVTAVNTTYTNNAWLDTRSTSY